MSPSLHSFVWDSKGRSHHHLTGNLTGGSGAFRARVKATVMVPGQALCLQWAAVVSMVWRSVTGPHLPSRRIKSGSSDGKPISTSTVIGLRDSRVVSRASQNLFLRFAGWTPGESVSVFLWLVSHYNRDWELLTDLFGRRESGQCVQSQDRQRQKRRGPALASLFERCALAVSLDPPLSHISWFQPCVLKRV